MCKGTTINLGLILLSGFAGFAWGYTKAREKFLEALILATPNADQDTSKKES